MPQHSSSDLAYYFIKNSSTFFNDKQIQNLDKKHQKIIDHAYELIETNEAFSEKNFRSWAGQTDLTSPVQLNKSNLKTEGFFKYLFVYLLKKMFRYRSECTKLSSLMDDFYLVNKHVGQDFITKNPVSATPGVKNSFKYKGSDFNFRWLRYLYLAHRIINLPNLNNKFIWIDIGNYYGGLQGLVRKYRPNATIIMVDFNHQLCRSYIYLSKLFPRARHVLPDNLNKSFTNKDIPNGSFVYVPIECYSKLDSLKPDLYSNFFSFGEMPEDVLAGYLKSNPYKNAKLIYLVNRVVSSPFFEPTYDNNTNILDYYLKENKIEYFDLFPVHNYNIFNRNLFGRNALRNNSSNYFEVLFKN